MEDKIRQALSGDANAFLQLMDAMSDHMYKTAFAILKNDEDVADAIQDTIISCYEKLGTLKEPRYFGTWAMRILINASLHILKRRTPCLDASDDVLSFIPAVDDGFSGMRFKELLAMADSAYHLLLTLYYADGYSIKEIADLLDMNENTVKTRLKRAREQIRRELHESRKVSCGS